MWGWIEDVEKSTSDAHPEAEVDHVPRRASLKKRLRPLPESVKTTASAVLKGSSSPLRVRVWTRPGVKVPYRQIRSAEHVLAVICW